MGYIGIIDYGVGNLMSVTNALNFLGYGNRILTDPREADGAAALILPGVGAFPAAAACLEKSGFFSVLKEQSGKKPVLGICLGMHLLFDRGLEFSPTPGLGLIGGQVRKIRTELKLPHIGWNSLDIQKASPLLNKVDNGAFVYFVHGYCGELSDSDHLVASSGYGEPVAAVVQNGLVFGTQFHPEKSGDIGLQMLRNFGEML